MRLSLNSCQVAGLSQNLDRTVINKIQKLVHEGVTSPIEMKRIIELEKIDSVDNSNKRFYPSLTTIQNHTAIQEKRQLKSSDDQKNLANLVRQFTILISLQIQYNYYFDLTMHETKYFYIKKKELKR